MDRLYLVVTFALGVAFGRWTSTEERRRVRWWVERLGRGEGWPRRRVELVMPDHWKPDVRER